MKNHFVLKRIPAAAFCLYGQGIKCADMPGQFLLSEQTAKEHNFTI